MMSEFLYSQGDASGPQALVSSRSHGGHLTDTGLDHSQDPLIEGESPFSAGDEGQDERDEQSMPVLNYESLDLPIVGDLDLLETMLTSATCHSGEEEEDEEERVNSSGRFFFVLS